MLGDLKVGQAANAQRFVDDAADEIDSVVGVRYTTPLNISILTSPPGTGSFVLTRPSALIIKRVSRMLSTGRLLMGVHAASEEDGIHEYGKALVNEALAWLVQIRNGEVQLDGAEPVLDANVAAGPVTVNYDATSGVDAFYDRVMKPENGLLTPLPYRDWAPGP